jgi:Transposase DDE domain group 1
VLRAGNAGSNTAEDHIETTRLALAQLPRRLRRKVLIRTGSGGGTHGFLTWLTAKSRRLHHSIGMTITEDMQAAILNVPADAWTPAYDGDGQVRDGAWVADITGMLDLSAWPAGMRVIVRRERPHPGRSFGSPTSTATASPPSPPTRAKASSPASKCATGAGPGARTGNAKDTGLRSLPLQGFAQNQVWCEIVALACELMAWMQMLALTGQARRREPKRLRLRLFSAAGRLARSSRRLRLRARSEWNGHHAVRKTRTD